ncbi:MAG: hypothetical protein A2Y90_05510 [Chloroflexi bacterium RBG_13_52_12]|nr:MAG: hypothetical protein A2Y90_05510 [Chloroflexi bacterium RBG_13_52_12]
MLWEQMTSFLKSWFIYPDLSWGLMLIGLGLAIVFAAIWLLGYWPPIFKKLWFWPVLVVGAFLSVLAVVFIQIPLQYYSSEVLLHFWSGETLYNWLLLAAIPQLLVSGLAQEGAKMVPMVAWWWRSGKNIDPKMGLFIGAMAGAGLGIFEAFWVHNQVFQAGWTVQVLQTGGFLGIAPFWERFFTLGFHIGVSALAGYGLAKGKGWQFYLIASGLHALLNWGVALLQKGYFSVVQLEVYGAVIAVVVMAVVMILRWRKRQEEVQIEPIEPTEPIKPVEIDI